MGTATGAAMKAEPARISIGPSVAPILAGIALLGASIAAALSAEGHHPAIIAHATLMTMAWAGLLPSGAVIARWCKVTRAQRFPEQLDNQFWWNRHRQFQYAGLGCSLLGFAAILWLTGGGLGSLHGQLGLLVVALSLAQLAGSALRGSKGGPTDQRADPARPETWRGDHFDMTRRRTTFEVVHKALGWGSLALAAATLALGVALLGLPMAVAALLGAAYAVLLAVMLRHIRARAWVDTYVAIWGGLRSPLLRPGVVPPP